MTTGRERRTAKADGKAHRGVGGVPQAVGRCTDCGSVYPLRETRSGDVHPIGSSGACKCGNSEFQAIPGE